MNVLVQCMSHTNLPEGCYYLAGEVQGEQVVFQWANNASDAIYVGLLAIAFLAIVNVVQLWRYRAWIHY
jgi:hypothetical protein